MQAEILKNGRIAGTRSSVYDVVMYTEGGWQVDEIADILQVTPAQVRAAIQYIEEHREEVMAVHREIEERNARGNPPEVEAKREATRVKMQAWLRERRRNKPQELNGAGDSTRCES
jgi:uncharacterized protein (DUF433 family)